MPALVITINNEKRGAILEATLGKVVIIGRDKECDVSLPDATGLSRRHCSITCTEEGFKLKDLDSTNGTFADNVRLVGEELLKEGVKYGIGNAGFQVMGLSLLAFAPKTESAAPSPQETKNSEEAPSTPDAAQAAPAKAPAAKRKRTPGRQASARALHMAKSLSNKLNPLSSNITTNSLSIIEILLILIITFYAGLALYNFLHGGSLLPPFLD